jgi:hypothetical protein
MAGARRGGGEDGERGRGEGRRRWALGWRKNGNRLTAELLLVQERKHRGLGLLVAQESGLTYGPKMGWWPTGFITPLSFPPCSAFTVQHI